MVGLIDDLSHITRATFQQDGDAILLLGDVGGELGGSEYLATIHGEVFGARPDCDLDREKAVIDVLLEAIRGGFVSSAHDCSDGGLGIALAECCIAHPEAVTGADIDLSALGKLSTREILFGETQGRVLISSVAPERIAEIAKKANVTCSRLGTIRRDSDALRVTLPNSTMKASLDRLRRAYHETIPTIMSRTPEHASIDELSPVAGH
jgi:phosphoribosylformylglycinamidine synthase